MATCLILPASAAAAAPERSQVGVDRREVRVGHELRREETAGVDVTELFEIPSAGELRTPLPLRVVAVAGGAPQAPLGERHLPGDRRRGASGERRVELPGALAGLRELAGGLHAD